MLIAKLAFFGLVAGCAWACARPSRDVNVPISTSADRSSGTETTYPVPGHAPQAITILSPPASVPNRRRAIVLIHGGGWVSGNRREMEDIGHVLASKGFTAATIEYTLAGPGTRWPAQLLDCQAAVRYVRSRARELKVDPREIGAAGVSAGGHLSLWLGVSDAPVGGVSSRVQAVGSISGVLDLTKPMTESGEKYQIVEKLLAENLHPTVQQKRAASPVYLLDANAPPVFLIQGKEDPLVPAEQSLSTRDRLLKLKRPVEFRMVDQMGHGLVVGPAPQREALDAMAAWFKKNLGA